MPDNTRHRVSGRGEAKRRIKPRIAGSASQENLHSMVSDEEGVTRATCRKHPTADLMQRLAVIARQPAPGASILLREISWFRVSLSPMRRAVLRCRPC